MVERLYEIDKLKVLVKRESVFGALQCDETSPAYQEILEEYDAIIDEMMTLAQPVGILGIFSLSAETATDEFPEGTPVLYGVMSIGDGIRKYSTQAFQSGNYVRGMLCDAIADEALFSLEGRMVEKVRESAVRRLEKKLLENGYESLEKFSVDRRHADKWLGEERIAELEQMRLEKEKERREQPVQLSLFDMEAS